MPKIVNSTFVSLDGVVNHMDRWHFDYIDDESDAIAAEQLHANGALLLGRRTYDVYATAWPGRPGAIAERINTMPKYVVSGSLREPPWGPVSVIADDVVAEIRRLKQTAEGDLLMHGYGALARELLAHDLLDELHIWVHPKLAGAGGADDRLLAEGVDNGFDLLGVRTLASGVVMLSYRARSAG